MSLSELNHMSSSTSSPIPHSSVPQSSLPHVGGLGPSSSLPSSSAALSSAQNTNSSSHALSGVRIGATGTAGGMNTASAASASTAGLRGRASHTVNARSNHSASQLAAAAGGTRPRTRAFVQSPLLGGTQDTNNRSPVVESRSAVGAENGESHLLSRSPIHANFVSPSYQLAEVESSQHPAAPVRTPGPVSRQAGPSSYAEAVTGSGASRSNNQAFSLLINAADTSSPVAGVLNTGIQQPSNGDIRIQSTSIVGGVRASLNPSAVAREAEQDEDESVPPPAHSSPVAGAGAAGSQMNRTAQRDSGDQDQVRNSNQVNSGNVQASVTGGGIAHAHRSPHTELVGQAAGIDFERELERACYRVDVLSDRLDRAAEILNREVTLAGENGELAAEVESPEFSHVIARNQHDRELNNLRRAQEAVQLLANSRVPPYWNALQRGNPPEWIVLADAAIEEEERNQEDNDADLEQKYPEHESHTPPLAQQRRVEEAYGQVHDGNRRLNENRMIDDGSQDDHHLQRAALPQSRGLGGMQHMNTEEQELTGDAQVLVQRASEEAQRIMEKALQEAREISKRQRTHASATNMAVHFKQAKKGDEKDMGTRDNQYCLSPLSEALQRKIENQASYNQVRDFSNPLPMRTSVGHVYQTYDHNGGGLALPHRPSDRMEGPVRLNQHAGAAHFTPVAENLQPKSLKMGLFSSAVRQPMRSPEADGNYQSHSNQQPLAGQGVTHMMSGGTANILSGSPVGQSAQASSSLDPKYAIPAFSSAISTQPRVLSDDDISRGLRLVDRACLSASSISKDWLEGQVLPQTASSFVSQLEMHMCIYPGGMEFLREGPLFYTDIPDTRAEALKWNQSGRQPIENIPRNDRERKMAEYERALSRILQMLVMGAATGNGSKKGSVPDMIVNQYAITNPHAAIKAILLRYTPATSIVKEKLELQFAQLTAKANERIEEYGARISKLAMELSQHGKDVTDKEKKTMFIRGLSSALLPDWEADRITRDQAMSFEHAVMHAKQSQQDREIRAGNLNASAKGKNSDPDAVMYTQMNNKGKNGVKKMDPDSRPKRDMSKVKCHKCGTLGHYKSDCQEKKKDDKQSENTSKENATTGKPVANEPNDGKQYCKYHDSRVKHSIDKCYLNPKNIQKSKSTTSAHHVNASDNKSQHGDNGNERVMMLREGDEDSELSSSSLASDSMHIDVNLDDDGLPSNFTKNGAVRFIVDTGCSGIVVVPELEVRNLKPSRKTVTTATNEILSDVKTGSILLFSRDGFPLSLNSVMVHRKFSRNLFGLSALNQLKGADKTVFTDDSVTVYHDDGSVLLSGPRYKGLYYITLQRHPPADKSERIMMISDELNVESDTESGGDGETGNCTVSQASVPLKNEEKTLLKQLHDTLGHVSGRTLKRLVSLGALKGVNKILKLTDAECNVECETCLLAKKTRHSYASSVPKKFKIKEPLIRLVFDLSGPINPPTATGKQYVFVAVDVGSGYLWTKLLNSKSEAADAIMNLITFISNQFKCWVKEVSTDNGGEFVNSTLSDYYSLHGIKQMRTDPYCPEQNGIAERINRFWAEMVRCMLIQSKAHWLLWGEALITATGIINTTRLSKEDNKTPAERLLGESGLASLYDRHPFGCTVYAAKNPPDIDNKLTARAVKLVYLGPSINNPHGGSHRGVRPDRPNMIVNFKSGTFKDSDFTAMKELRDELQAGDNEQEESLTDSLTRVTLEAEIRLAKLISLEDQSNQRSDSESAEVMSSGLTTRTTRQMNKSVTEQAKEVSNSADTQIRTDGLPLRRSTRVTHPVSKLGMVSDGDLGQARLLVASDKIYELEAIATAEAFSAYAVNVGIGRKSAQGRVEALAYQAQLKAATAAAETNSPMPLNRPKCNKNGEIITPSQPCTAKRLDGMQCGNRTCNGQYCYAHTIAKLGLKIAKSSIVNGGRGLWAMKDIERGEEIAKYTGHLSLDPNVDHGGSKYVVGLSSDITIDAAPRNTAPGRLINDPKGTGKRSNTVWKLDVEGRKARIVATRKIRKGEELFLSYGPSYWATVRQQAKRDFSEMSSARKLTLERQQLVKAALRSAKQPAQVLALGMSQSLDNPEPKTYEEAEDSQYSKLWMEAMKKEQDSLNANNVLEVVSHLPVGAKILGTKWVYKYKWNADGSLERCKARVVAQGYRQRLGYDYSETYSGVVGMESIKLLLALACQLDLEIQTMDVETAFLNAPLTENIYIKAPKGFTDVEPGTIFKLNRALYGLKQAGREWNHTLVAALVAIGYVSCKYSDPCVMKKTSRTGRLLIVALFVDDLPHFFHRDDAEEMKADKAALGKRFKIKDLGDAHLLLGLRITRDRAASTLTVDQQPHTVNLLKEYGFSRCRTEPTPASVGSMSSKVNELLGVNSANPSSETVKKINVETYLSVVGSLQYLATQTRPDLCSALRVCSLACSSPTEEGVQGLKRIFRYLSLTPSLGIKYTKVENDDGLTIVTYTDADWANNKDDRKSITGVAVKAAGALVAWVSQRQDTVANSTAEAEFIAGNKAAKLTVFIRRLAADIGVKQCEPTMLLCDNQTTIRMTKDENGQERRKHIDVKYHYIRELQEKNEINIQYVESADNQADLFTKPLAQGPFITLRDALMGHASTADHVKHKTLRERMIITQTD